VRAVWPPDGPHLSGSFGVVPAQRSQDGQPEAGFPGPATRFGPTRHRVRSSPFSFYFLISNFNPNFKSGFKFQNLN
jgi:hypothetical protein